MRRLKLAREGPDHSKLGRNHPSQVVKSKTLYGKTSNSDHVVKVFIKELLYYLNSRNMTTTIL